VRKTAFRERRPQLAEGLWIAHGAESFGHFRGAKRNQIFFSSDHLSHLHGGVPAEVAAQIPPTFSILSSARKGSGYSTILLCRGTKI